MVLIERKRIHHRAVALICSCLFPVAAWAADDAPALRATVDAAIRPVMAEYDVPGMAVAVTINGQSWFFNYGLASKEGNTPVSEHTLFELGSISKTFTATLAAYAQEQGMLSLTDHPGKYLPQLKGSAIDKASLLHLVTYTAGGLPLQVPAQHVPAQHVPAQHVPDNVPDLDGAMRYFQGWKPDAAPGTQRRYSNPSIGLFGHIVGRAMKRDFAGAAEQVLFPQIGLRHTWVHVPPAAQADYAWGYNKANKAIRVNPGVFDAEAYGVKSNAVDMIRYVQANIEPGRLTGPMRRAVEATHVGHFEVGPMVQGLGWEQYPYPVSLERLLAGNAQTMIMEPNPARQLSPARTPTAPALFNKTGSTGGFGGYVVFVPEKKIGIVMLANKNYPIPARIRAAHAIMEGIGPISK